MQLKCLEKIKIDKLFKYNIWWNFLEFSDKMDPTMQIRIFNNEKHCHAICLKFGDRSFPFLTMSGLEGKANIWKIQFYTVVSFRHLMPLL